jgi:hypothetical protein
MIGERRNQPERHPEKNNGTRNSDALGSSAGHRLAQIPERRLRCWPRVALDEIDFMALE